MTWENSILMILAIYPSINQPVNHAITTWLIEELRGKNGKNALQIIACQLLLTGLRKNKSFPTPWVHSVMEDRLFLFDYLFPWQRRFAPRKQISGVHQPFFFLLFAFPIRAGGTRSSLPPLWASITLRCTARVPLVVFKSRFFGTLK